MSNQPVKPPQVSTPTSQAATPATPTSQSTSGNQTHSIYDRGPNPYQIAQRLGWTSISKGLPS